MATAADASADGWGSIFPQTIMGELLVSVVIFAAVVVASSLSHSAKKASPWRKSKAKMDDLSPTQKPSTRVNDDDEDAPREKPRGAATTLRGLRQQLSNKRVDVVAKRLESLLCANDAARGRKSFVDADSAGVVRALMRERGIPLEGTLGSRLIWNYEQLGLTKKLDSALEKAQNAKELFS